MSKKGLTGINKIFQSKDNKPSGGHWSLGLLSAMNDPSSVVEEDETIVAIKDKYPKAKHHFLVLPKESIADLKKLTVTHLPLLRHMADVGKRITAGLGGTFRMGYHTAPSMHRLHMHVISDDFDSPCLKTKIHWNSFNTDFFIPYDDLLRNIEENNTVKLIVPPGESLKDYWHKKLTQTALKCHKCDFTHKTMPELKKHISTHL